MFKQKERLLIAGERQLSCLILYVFLKVNCKKWCINHGINIVKLMGIKEERGKVPQYKFCAIFTFTLVIYRHL